MSRARYSKVFSPALGGVTHVFNQVRFRWFWMFLSTVSKTSNSSRTTLGSSPFPGYF